MIPVWDQVRCVRCVACVGTCPVEAIRLTAWRIMIENGRCTGCGSCERICPLGAISLGRERDDG